MVGPGSGCYLCSTLSDLSSTLVLWGSSKSDSEGFWGLLPTSEPAARAPPSKQLKEKKRVEARGGREMGTPAQGSQQAPCALSCSGWGFVLCTPHPWESRTCSTHPVGTPTQTASPAGGAPSHSPRGLLSRPRSTPNACRECRSRTREPVAQPRCARGTGSRTGIFQRPRRLSETVTCDKNPQMFQDRKPV